jgi:predicted transposase/invertase (TIGR01784 family)
MGMAVGRLKQLSADEATRLRYEARELYLMDEMARNEAAFAEGEAKGREEEKTALARNALQMGMSIGDISRLTGFSEREISSLIH